MPDAINQIDPLIVAMCPACRGTRRVPPFWNSELGCTSETCPNCRERVNHPSHYGGDTVYECVKVIEAWELGFHLGNAVKYIARAGRKTPDAIMDLEKAAWYLEREITRRKAAEAAKHEHIGI